MKRTEAEDKVDPGRRDVVHHDLHHGELALALVDEFDEALRIAVAALALELAQQEARLVVHERLVVKDVVARPAKLWPLSQQQQSVGRSGCVVGSEKVVAPFRRSDALLCACVGLTCGHGRRDVEELLHGGALALCLALQERDEREK